MMNCLVNLGIYLNLYTKCLLSMWLGNSMKNLFIEISKVSVGGMLGMGFGNDSGGPLHGGDPGSWAGEWMSPGMGDETLTSPVLNLVIFHTVARFIISANPLTLLWGRKYLGCSCFTLDGKKKKKERQIRGPWTMQVYLDGQGQALNPQIGMQSISPLHCLTGNLPKGAFVQASNASRPRDL